MRHGCWYFVGLGAGVVLAGGVVYVLATSEMARLLALGIGMFLAGGLIVGFFVSYTARSVAQAFGAQRQDTTYNVLPPGDRGAGRSDWIEAPAARFLPPPPPTMEAGERARVEDEDFVA